MTEQEINIAIAEFCGGIWLYNPDAENPHRFLFMPENQSISHMHLFRECKNMDIPIAFDMMQGTPNYYGDLNAVHEAEEKIQWGVYPAFLAEVVNGTFHQQRIHPIPENAWRAATLATAPQRCEALLRAIGKWKQ